VSKGREAFGSGHWSRRPAARPIPRPALLSRLDAADTMIVLLAAPGAGKSTLLDAWTATHAGTLTDLSQAPPQSWPPPAGPLAIDNVGAADAARLAPLANRRGVVVAATQDPGIPGATLITASELAFAEDETYQVLAGALADAEAADALAPDLHLLTHGWPALVSLSGAWLAQHPAPERRARLRALARVEDDLIEHLVPLVIAALPSADRELLRRLAHLPALDARLADHLDITEDLAPVPPFVQPLARRPGSYAVPDSWRPALTTRELPLAVDELDALQTAYRAAC
jgi:ATP/maltotriose-dependent transcriptional regulator MalT